MSKETEKPYSYVDAELQDVRWFIDAMNAKRDKMSWWRRHEKITPDHVTVGAFKLGWSKGNQEGLRHGLAILRGEEKP